MTAIRRAGPDDAGRIVAILAGGFMDDPVSRWLLPDDAERAARHPAFFQIFTDQALAHGAAYLSVTGDAAALWLDISEDRPLPEIPEDLLAAALGPSHERFGVLDALMEASHPRRSHAYLPFVAAIPGGQGRGTGTALLTHRLTTLDATGTPAFLVASSARSRRLYERLGFAALPATINLPDGPSMYPMWRGPALTP